MTFCTLLSDDTDAVTPGCARHRHGASPSWLIGAEFPIGARSGLESMLVCLPHVVTKGIDAQADSRSTDLAHALPAAVRGLRRRDLCGPVPHRLRPHRIGLPRSG